MEGRLDHSWDLDTGQLALSKVREDSGVMAAAEGQDIELVVMMVVQISPLEISQIIPAKAARIGD